MSGFLAMLHKETLEAWRTHKLLVSCILYLLVGIASPLLAKLTPAMLAMIPQEQLGGVELLITKDPAVADAMAQYLGNIILMPVLAVLLTMGAVAGEKRRHTLGMLLARPVGRRALLAAKLVVPLGIHALGMLLAAGACGLYTLILFGELHWPTYLAVNGLLLLGMWFFVVLTLLASAISRSSAVAAALGIGAYVALLTLTGLPSLARYTPAGLFTAASDLALGKEPILLGLTLVVSFGTAALALLLADRSFARQEID